MPKPACIADVFFPGNINASSGLTPIRLPFVSRTLALAPGSYALTGKTVLLGGNRNLGIGSYLLTGNNVTLKAARIFHVDAGSYALTGVSIQRTLMVAGGSYAVTGIAAALARSAPLDGFTTGLTGTWSMSRKMLSNYAANGGDFYHTTSSAVDIIYDQSGNSRNITDGGVAARRPAVSTAGSNSIACADFDGSTDSLSGAAISNFGTSSNFYLIITAVIDSVTLNNSLMYQNDLLMGDAGVFQGIYLRNNGPNAFGYNWDGSAGGDGGNTSFTTGAVHVFEWRHEGGVVYMTVDGTEVSASSGNTTTMTGLLSFFGRGTQFANGKMFEAATWSTVPSSGDRTTIRNAFKNYAGT